MIIFPAIDLRGGRVVRLKQGRVENQIVYSDDPAEIAARWQGEGAQWLHVVDLDRALGDSSQPNAAALKKMAAAVQIPIQFGGGVRDLEHIARALEWGASRVVIGTMAVENARQLEEALLRFGAEKIAVAIDMREGRVAVHGWQALSDVDAVELGISMREIGVLRAVVTDIARDGMLSGIDAEALADFAEETELRVIASGGIATLEDLRALQRFENAGIEGAIVGQALYTGAINLSEAIALTHSPSRQT